MINKKDVYDFLNSRNFVPSKKMGQNFLVDSNVAEKIANLAGNQEGFESVLEIGPGLGAISTFLKKRNFKNYKAIELDKRLNANLLEKKVFAENNLICGDALKIDWDTLFDKDEKVCLVGNLPYSISSPLLAKFLKTKNMKTAVLMLQSEMADRVAAKVNSKDYNSFTVFMQLNSKITKNFVVESSCFVPKPNVKSCIVTLMKNQSRDDLYNEDELRSFLSFCFNQRRKTIANNLKNYFAKEKIALALKLIDKKEIVRPQELNPEEFLSLMKSIYDN